MHFVLATCHLLNPSAPSPAHLLPAGGQYAFKTATPGAKYEIWVYGRNPALGASGNGAGMRSAPMMAPVGVTTAGRR